MNKTLFQTKLDKTILNSWTLRIVVIAQSIVIIALLVFNFIEQSQQKTIMLPPKITKDFWVAGDIVSKGYMIQMGSYLSQTLLDFTPKTYLNSVHNFLIYVYPASYGYLDTHITEQLHTVTELGVSQIFYPQVYKFDLKKSLMVIQGQLVRFSNKHKTAKEKYFLIKYLMRNGRFYVTAVSLSSKNPLQHSF